MTASKETARFEQLFRANYGRVLAFARRRGSTDVEDVAAETFLIAWRRLDAVPRDELPWLLAVARRILRTRDLVWRPGARGNRRSE